MENNILIEQMTSKDIDGVFEVEKNCFEHHWSKDAFKKELKDKILPIPDNIYLHDQWIGMIAELEGKTYFLNEILMKYRRHSENNSSFKHLPVIKMFINRVNYTKEVIKYKKEKEK